ncbi:TPA: hypothetical protein DEP58_00085 [Patescibacteria group bacterium]|nr:MAG: Tyrosine recombinase XerC [Parcubacteria group bacterium GW2011_GWD2_42_14]HCC04689.1 hypothetical protein [Patescibacteria group bacterium]
MPKTELESLKDAYLSSIATEQGKSKKTVENYTRYLDRFFSNTQVIHPKDITIPIVEKYRTGLTVLKTNTQNYHLTALRRLLDYLKKHQVSSLEPEMIKLTPSTTFSVQSMSPHDVRSLLQASQGKDVKSLRDRAILLLFFRTGMRVSELCALDVDSFSDNRLVKYGTGVRARSVLLPTEARDALCAYLDVRSDPHKALFVNNGKRFSSEGDTRLSVRQVERIIKQCALQVGIVSVVTPQRLRSLYAQDLLKNGADVGSVQELLGHQHVASTKVYYKNNK